MSGQDDLLVSPSCFPFPADAEDELDAFARSLVSEGSRSLDSAGLSSLAAVPPEASRPATRVGSTEPRLGLALRPSSRPGLSTSLRELAAAGESTGTLQKVDVFSCQKPTALSSQLSSSSRLGTARLEF